MTEVEHQGQGQSKDKDEDEDEDWLFEDPRSPTLEASAPALPTLAHNQLHIQDMGLN